MWRCTFPIFFLFIYNFPFKDDQCYEEIFVAIAGWSISSKLI